MKIVVLLGFCLSAYFINAQESDYIVPKFVKKSIGESGCFAYMPDEMNDDFELQYSPDSSMVYRGEVNHGGFNFGVIVVKFNGFELASDEMEDMLVSYLDYLQSTVDIHASAGYGKGHVHSITSSAQGIIDYWEDIDGNQWAVKGWINESSLAVLYIEGAEEYPNFNVQQMYLDGFRFE